jgi:hypothetical protein
LKPLSDGASFSASAVLSAAPAAAAAQAAASFKASSTVATPAAQTSPKAHDSAATASVGLTIAPVPTLAVPAAGDSKRPPTGTPLVGKTALAQLEHAQDDEEEEEQEQEEQEEHGMGTSDTHRKAVESQANAKPYDPAVKYSLLPETEDNFKLTQAPETPSGILGAVKGAARRVTRTLSKASIPR